ncbi:unnamed protein product [Rotaria sp. Silwood2]|nr:unnamed protein product [Rotaria sp. Silwood2]CAF2661794.1 unnamed protein product [Rotaria sp. Silwood2]CAF3072585.1 unnamed protein product [Rotaria sp. Silwood2]CAF4016816.1 unnamed protein product [Rotaria sp. Silwood2]CAF4224898.1 unnamed protein product [Rotaria sp. Silwood2]
MHILKSNKGKSSLTLGWQTVNCLSPTLNFKTECDIDGDGDRIYYSCNILYKCTSNGKPNKSCSIVTR